MTTVESPPAVAEREEPTPLGRNKNFILLWTGAGISILGSRISAIAYGLLVLWATGSPVLTSLVTFAALLPYLVTQLPAGALIDRLNRKHVMIFCDILRAAAIGVIAVTVLMGHIWIPLLMVVAFIEGSLTVAYVIAERAAVFVVVDETQIGGAIGANEARGQAAGLIGQPIGSFLYAVTQSLPFVATAVTHIVSLGTLLLIKKDLQGERNTENRASILADIAEGIRFVNAQKYLRRALMLIAASNILFQVLALGLLVIVNRSGGTPATVGLILVASGVGGMLGALTSNYFLGQFGIRRLFIAVNVVWFFLMTSIAFTQAPASLGVIFFLIMYAAGVGNVAGIVYSMKITPEHLQGRVGSIATLMASGANAFGALIAGGILEILSVTVTMLAMGGAMLVIAVLAVLAFSGRQAVIDEHADGVTGKLFVPAFLKQRIAEQEAAVADVGRHAAPADRVDETTHR